MTTQNEINLKNSFGIYKIETLSICVVPNEHAKASIVGVASDFEEYNSWKNTDEDKLVEICVGDDTVLFAGYVISAECSYESKLHHISLELISTSEGIDRERKSKSFQNVAASYKDIVQSCVGEEKAYCTFNIGEEKKIERPIIRYRETTWEFAVRMASHFNSVIYPVETASRASICFGFRGSSDVHEISVDSYSHGIDERYWSVKGKTDAYASDFEYYKIISSENHRVGEMVFFDNRRIYIVEKRCVLRKSVLEFEYILSGRQFINVPKIYREGFAGLSILGKVLSTGGETVKLHLDIDKLQEETKAYPYKWTPDTGSVMYCMPEKGTTVSLYFPDDNEQNAIAVSCIRENGGKCQAMTNTDMKNFANPTGMEMYLHPEETGLKVSGSCQMVELSDNNGIDIGGTMKVCMYAADTIEFDGKRVNIDTPEIIQMIRS